MKKDYLIPLTKIEYMSSLEIADITGKRHDNVLRDIRSMLDELYEGSSNLSYKEIQGVTPEFDLVLNRMTNVKLDKVHTLTLVTGYSHKLRKAVIDRWQYLEEQLENLKFHRDDKRKQLDAMEALHDMLPDDLQGEALSYMKANTIVNKATSNLFGFPKLLKKDQMSKDMLEVRERVMDDYLKLYDVMGDNTPVKEFLYSKYQPNRLESL